MLKKITAQQLRIGMFINDLDCSWLKHPFTLNKFLIEDAHEIQKIRAALIKSIEIDTSKGLDVLPEKTKDIQTQSLKSIYKKTENKSGINNVKVGSPKRKYFSSLAPAKVCFRLNIT